MASFAGKKYFSHPGWSRLGDIALLWSVLLAGTIFPRLILLGGPPLNDEGYYAFLAQWIHHNLVTGQGLPDTGTLSLYPMLFSWVFYFEYNPMIMLRIIDLGMAVLAAFFLYRLLEKESGSKAGAALIVLVFTFTMNMYEFINYGFKNSITVAYIPLFWAVCIGQKILYEKKAEASIEWWKAGALTALAVVFRETFIPFAVLGLVSVFMVQGRKAAFHFFLGGMVAGALLIGGILIAHGSVTETIGGYRTSTYLFGSVPKNEILDNFFIFGFSAIELFSTALMVSAAAGFVLIIIAVIRQNKRILLNLIFWLCFAGVALIEPATKIGYQYHFAVALPGLAGLCALTLREVAREYAGFSWANNKTKDAIALIGVMLSMFWFSSEIYLRARDMLPITLETLRYAPNNEWPEEFHEPGSFTGSGDVIKKLIPENATLSVNRNSELFFPYTGRLPPSKQMANLSLLGFELDFSVPRIREALMACAPDAILMNSYDDWMTGNRNAQLFAAIHESGIYEGVYEIAYIDMDDIRVVLYKKTTATNCAPSHKKLETLQSSSQPATD